MAGTQPSSIEPYLQQGNAATRNPLEAKATEAFHGHGQDQNAAPAGATAAAAQTQSPNAGVPTSRGRGVHGGEPVDEREAQHTRRGEPPQRTLENDSVNAEQMATLAEGKVADAVDRKSGTQQAPGQGPAEEQDFASDLDRKKAEQASAREQVKAAKQGGSAVDGGAGRVLGNESLADA